MGGSHGLPVTLGEAYVGILRTLRSLVVDRTLYVFGREYTRTLIISIELLIYCIKSYAHHVPFFCMMEQVISILFRSVNALVLFQSRSSLLFLKPIRACYYLGCLNFEQLITFVCLFYWIYIPFLVALGKILDLMAKPKQQIYLDLKVG